MEIKKGEKVYFEFVAEEEMMLSDSRVIGELLFGKLKLKGLDFLSVTPERNMSSYLGIGNKEKLTSTLLKLGALDTRTLENVYCNCGGFEAMIEEDNDNSFSS